jgi:sugar lactone lactonase YvrE
MAEYSYEVTDPELRRLIREEAPVERIAAGLSFTEGPVWRGDHLLFSDIPNSRIIRWREKSEGPEVTTFRTPSGNSNGLTLDRLGRLIACEHSTRRVSRTEADESVIVLVDRYQGRRLNSPNDVVVRSDGSIYFTDPPYGLPNQSEGREIPFNGVYRLSPDGSLALLADDFERPNGLAFSPDEKILYVDDTARHHIRAFRVDPSGGVTGGGVFAELRSSEPGGPDGMKVDVEGNIYSTGSGGIWVFAPNGRKLGRMVLPELPANVAWGGSDWRTLFVTARTGVYRLRLEVAGIPVG